MKELITALFGVYTPVLTDEVTLAADGTSFTVQVVAAGLAGVDWSWLAGVFLFAVVLYCALRIVGGLAK